MASVRRSLFTVLAAFILLSPAAKQVLGYEAPWVRSWVMFSGVGVGILKGSFTTRTQDGAARELTPLEVLDLPRYPMMRSYLFPQMVMDEDGLRAFAAPYCERVGAHEHLSYRGLVGTRNGWKPLEASDICASARTQVGERGASKEASGV